MKIWSDARRIEDARAMAGEIARFVLETPQETSQAACGAALLAGRCALATGDAEAVALVRQCLDVAIDVRSPLIGLHGGLAEIGWVIAHLERAGVLDPSPRDHSLLRALDTFLCDKTADPKTRYDLVYGLAGFGIYAIERGLDDEAPRALLGAIVHELERRAKDAEGIGSYLIDETAEPGFVDFGLAHGLAGLLPVLAEAVRADVERAVAEPLLSRLEATLAHAHLAGGSTLDGLHLDRRPERIVSRRPLGWCYGALGIASATAAAARARGDRAQAATARLERLVESAPALDAPFVCHGHAGAAVLLRRHAVADDAMMAALEAKRDRAAPLYGFRTGPDGRGVDLLTGAAGIALALLPGAAGWDRILGASTPSDE